jgi:hypothetical protein
VRERVTTAREFDTAEIRHGRPSEDTPSIRIAAIPLAVVLVVNLIMAFGVLPRLDVSYLAEERWGATSLAGVGGIWAVLVALTAGIITLVALNHRLRCQSIYSPPSRARPPAA